MRDVFITERATNTVIKPVVLFLREVAVHGTLSAITEKVYIRTAVVQ